MSSHQEQPSTASTTAPFPRGWVGFGRNYFHCLGSEEFKDIPPTILEEESPHYDWGLGMLIPPEASEQAEDTATRNNNLKQTEDTATNKENEQQIDSGTNTINMQAYQYTKEIPSRPKKAKSSKMSKLKPNKSNSNSEDDHKQIAPAACSSAASYFLSGSRHNRITMVGTIHGHIMDPVLEEQSQQLQQNFLSPSTITIPLPLPCVELAAGRHFCLARLEGGLAVCSWGAGHFGQLGHGANYSQSSQSGMDSDGNNTSTYQSTPKVMERLLPRMVGSPIAQIAAGDWHGMALTQDGTVLAWGCNRNLQCGRKPPRNASKSGASSAASSASAPLQMIPMPVTILNPDPNAVDNASVPIIKITCGKAHSVAISKQHHVYCWGAAHYGQCASNTSSSSHSSSAPGNNNNTPPPRMSKYTRNTMTLPRRVETIIDCAIVDVAAGDRHTLAVTQGGRVFAWGAGSEGQLGIFPPFVATPRPRLIQDLDFVAIAANELQKKNVATGATLSKSDNAALASVPTIVSVHAAGCSSMALSSAGHVYAWGSNDTGSLGLPIPHASQLPYWEMVIPSPRQKRLLQVRTFDSQHNVLLPRRVDALQNICVEDIMMGPAHTWCLGEGRIPAKSSPSNNNADNNNLAVGLTLYEVQEGRKHSGSVIGVSSFASAGSSLTDGGVPSSSWEGGTPTSTSNTNERRRLMSHSSTLATDEEDDFTTTDNSMSASMPAMTDVPGRRGVNDDAADGGGSRTRMGRRFSDSASQQIHTTSGTSTNKSNKPFSFQNFLRKLGGSSRRGQNQTTSSKNNGGNNIATPNNTPTSTVHGGADQSNASGGMTDGSASGGKSRFRLRPSKLHE